MQIAKEDINRALGESARSCYTKEYFVDRDRYESYWDFRVTGSFGHKSGFGFSYKIGSAESTSQTWTNKIVKTVHKEYYVMTEIGLIGTVGGTLGLFVGLSFANSGTVMMRAMKNVLSSRIVRKKPSKNRNIP